jgi:hypothetical protein
MWVYEVQSKGQIVGHVRKTMQNYKNVSVISRLLGIGAFLVSERYTKKKKRKISITLNGYHTNEKYFNTFKHYSTIYYCPL